jgi:ADP-ribose pyrophosphatase YjhB (NUDIX family)
MNKKLYDTGMELFSIAQAGLTYGVDPYDIARCQRIKKLSFELMSAASGISVHEVREIFQYEQGYNTPKVDVRGVIFHDGKILMVKEKSDGRWTLPGGWAEYGLSPAESVVKEVQEEAGYSVSCNRLLAIFDKRKHAHPNDIFHIYKIFFQCEILSTVESDGLETSAVAFFGRGELPELSAGRITREQLNLMFTFLDEPHKAALFD